MAFILVKCKQMAYHEDLAYVELGEYEALLNTQSIVLIYESADYGGCCITMINGEHLLSINELNEITQKIISAQALPIFQ